MDTMSDAPKINTNWREQEWDVLQKCHAGDIDDFLAQVGDKKMTVEQIHLASTHVAHRILAEKHNEILHSRNQWRECAVRLAGSIALAPVVPTNSMKSALADFDRLKGETK
jgi:hypothetical protein